jgi:hypothetical protein
LARNSNREERPSQGKYNALPLRLLRQKQKIIIIALQLASPYSQSILSGSAKAVGWSLVQEN